MLAERQQQLTTKMEKNREARAESQRRREELIKELEAERDLRRKEKGEQESRRAAWVQEIDAQVGPLGKVVRKTVEIDPKIQMPCDRCYCRWSRGARSSWRSNTGQNEKRRRKRRFFRVRRRS